MARVNSLKHKAWVWYVLLFALYALVYIAYTYPLIHHFDSVFLGSGDAHISIFNVTHMKKVFSGESDLFFTNYQFAPEGSSMIMHTANWTMSFFAAFFNSEELGVNIYLMFSYIFSGIGACLFANRFLNHKVHSFLCGLIFSFSSYKMVRLGCHYNLVLTVSVPFMMIYWDKIRCQTDGFKAWLLDMSLVKNFLILSLFFILSLFSDYIVTISILYFMLLYFSYSFVRNFYDRLSWKPWVKWLAIILVFVFLDQLALFLKTFEINDNSAMNYGADILGFFIPVSNKWFEFETLRSFYFGLVGDKAYNHEYVVFLGFCLLGLGLIALTKLRSVTLDTNIKPLFFTMIVFFFLMLPSIKFADVRLMYGPSAFVHFIPFVNQMRAPVRFVFIFEFLLSITIFYALINSSLKHMFKKFLVSVVITLVVFLELWPPEYKMNDSTVRHDYYDYLKDQPKANLLVYPFGVVDGFASRGKFDLEELSKIRFHNKPILGGHVSRLDETTFKNVDGNKFLSVLSDQSRDFMGCEASFNKLRIGYVAINNQYLSDSSVISMQFFLENHSYNKVKLKDGIVWQKNL